MNNEQIGVINAFALKNNFFILDKNLNEKYASKDKINMIDMKGYKYQGYYYNIAKGYSPLKFHRGNLYAVENINLYLNKSRPEYICVSEKYINNNTALEFKHETCGKKFTATLIEMQGKTCGVNKYYKTCPYCQHRLKESLHASILKQVFIHEFPSTSLEDKSCINPKTKRPLPTDIVNHDLKIAIEIQSAYHDDDEQKLIDSFKSNLSRNPLSL